MQGLRKQDELEQREMREQTIQLCLMEIRKPELNEDREGLMAGLQIIQKLINNLIKNPQDKKFRTINLANQTIK